MVRRVEKATVYAVTVPLIVDKATGKKFGKSEGNAVWLNENLTSSYELFQFWFNVSDESVIEYLKLFTFLSLDEISDIEKVHLEAPQRRLAQETLAHEIVTFVHSFDAAQAAKKVTEVLFGKVELKDLSATELELVKQNAPKSQTKNGDSIVELMIATGLAESKREAKTFIESKAVFVNDILVEDIEAVIDESKFGQLFIMKRGKKTRVLVEIT